MTRTAERSLPRRTDCTSCRAACCNHLALHIDKPSCKRDYDNIRWFLMHEGIKVFVDHDNDWLVEFKTACTELRSDFRCGSYETRPRVCRDYPGPTQECEFESADSPYKLLFTNVSEFEQYLESRGIDWKYRT